MTTLAQQIKELKAQLEQVREFWFPWPGHPTGEHFGVSAHTLDGERFALRQEYGFGPLFVWTGDRWQPLQAVPHLEAYRWTAEEVFDLGPKLAVEEAATHPVVEPVSPAEVADEIQELINLSRSVFPATEVA